MNRILQQEQQGFFPSIALISQIPRTRQPQEDLKPLDYQPRVLARTCIENKLPIQILQPFTEIPLLENNHNSLVDNDCEGQGKEDVLSPYEKYVRGSAHKLVYSKSRKVPFFEGQEDCAKREVELSSILKYESQNYSLLKQSQINQTRNTLKEQSTLLFDSRFECGNLLCAYQSLRQPYTFDCFIQNDTNTSGYNQWFYFSLQNMQRNTIYKFNFVNLSKKFSFLRIGMKPTLFSAERHQREGNGWFRRGYNIKYKPSDVYDVKQGVKVKLYCATFDLDFDYASDFVTISLGVPYSYSRLVNQLKTFKNNAMNNEVSWHQQTLCHTVSSNQVPYLTITKENQDFALRQIDKKTEKSIIVFLARQHPGEMHSSFIMEKILEALSKNSNPKIDWLLDKYQFRIFPMINVDGVIYGNFRCDLVGLDLNRCWKKPIAQLHPQIFAIEKQIQSLSKRHKIACCIDLHSHSKQLNVFSYCNKNDQIESRLLSLIISKNCQLFHFPSCTFGLSKEKESTARAVLGLFTNNQNALTIEFSSFGYKSQEGSAYFSIKDFADASLAILASLKSFYCNGKQRKNCLKEIEENLYKYKAYCKRSWEVQSGSQSDHIAEFTELQAKLKTILPVELITNIKRRLKQDLDAVNQQNIRREAAQWAHQPSIEGPPKRERPIKMIRKRNNTTLVTEVRQMRKPIEILEKKKIEKEISIEPVLHNWRSNRMNERIKTEPKYQEQLSQTQKSERYSTPNKGTIKKDFKYSMKMLYKQLICVQDQDLESTLIVNNAKQQAIERPRDDSRSYKMQKILKVRRRHNTFRSILSGKQVDSAAPLLKIKSESGCSTFQAISQSISPIAANSRLDKLLPTKDENPRNNYVSQISFLNKYLKSNIKDTLRFQK